MEHSTQCPVCGKNLEGSFEATTSHVNMCMDNKESLDAIGNIFSSEIASAALDGKRTFKYCPICYKLSGVNAKHIKSCGKFKGIDTRELIRMCETEPEAAKATNSKSTKAAKSKATKKAKDSPFGPGCTKEVDDDPKKSLNQPKTKQPSEFLFKPKKPPKPRKQVEKKEKEPVARKRKTKAVKGKVDLNQSILQPSTSGLMIKLTKPIGISSGELTKLSIKEKKERIRNRIALIMSRIICPNNFVSTYFQNELPYSWTLSSLNNNQIKYVVDGFERFCSESQEFTDKNETFSFIEKYPEPVKETNQEKANTEDHNANISTDSVSSNLSEDKCFDTTANTGMLELPDLTFSTPDKINDRYDIFAKSDRDSPDIPSSQPVPKSIYA